MPEAEKSGATPFNNKSRKNAGKQYYWPEEHLIKRHRLMTTIFKGFKTTAGRTAQGGLWLLWMALLAGAAVNGQPLKGKKILVFSKTTGFRHESIAQGKAMFLQLGQKEGFTADTTENAGVFTSDVLGRYDIIVFMNTTGTILDETGRDAFRKFIQSGKGFLGIHAATDTEYEWPWYHGLAGAYFESHPRPQQAVYTNLQPGHPAASGWPARFSRFEEIYNFRDLLKTNLSFVLTVDEKSYQGGKMQGFHPMAWYQLYDGGKAFYTALGHHPETYADPDFRKHILGALQWLSGK